MMTPEEDVEAHALRKQGWTISAIARHLDRDRKTVRAYLNGERQPGVRRPAGPDPFDVVADYIGQRLTDDPHVLATALFDEAVALGYPRSYPTFTRQIRDRRLRPVCPACARGSGGAHDRDRASGGEETQWDWVELPGRRGWMAGRRCCWSARCRTRRGPAGCSATRPIRRTPSTGSTGSAPGWVG
jgi:hypothetical protein